MARTTTAAGANRPDKVAVVDEVRRNLEGSTAMLLTEYRGLSVAELAELRAELRRNDAEYKVVKNTLTRIAARDAGLEIADELLTGPTAVTFCKGDPVGVAKALRAFSKTHPELVIKGGFLEGRAIDAAETLRLADLESREELLAKLAGMMGAILAQPARLAQASLTKMARLLAALQQQKPATPDAPTEAPAPEAASDESSETPDAPAEPGAEERAQPEAEAEAPAEEPKAEDGTEAAPAEKAPEASADAETATEAPADDT